MYSVSEKWIITKHGHIAHDTELYVCIFLSVWIVLIVLTQELLSHELIQINLNVCVCVCVCGYE